MASLSAAACGCGCDTTARTCLTVILHTCSTHNVNRRRTRTDKQPGEAHAHKRGVCSMWSVAHGGPHRYRVEGPGCANRAAISTGAASIRIEPSARRLVAVAARWLILGVDAGLVVSDRVFTPDELPAAVSVQQVLPADELQKTPFLSQLLCCVCPFLKHQMAQKRRFPHREGSALHASLIEGLVCGAEPPLHPTAVIRAHRPHLRQNGPVLG